VNILRGDRRTRRRSCPRSDRELLGEGLWSWLRLFGGEWNRKFLWKRFLISGRTQDVVAGQKEPLSGHSRFRSLTDSNPRPYGWVAAALPTGPIDHLVHERVGINFCTYIVQVGRPGAKPREIDGNSQSIDGNTSCTWPVSGADGFTSVENFSTKVSRLRRCLRRRLRRFQACMHTLVENFQPK
jgi:hypothetical protein